MAPKMRWDRKSLLLLLLLLLFALPLFLFRDKSPILRFNKEKVGQKLPLLGIQAWHAGQFLGPTDASSTEKVEGGWDGIRDRLRYVTKLC